MRRDKLLLWALQDRNIRRAAQELYEDGSLSGGGMLSNMVHSVRQGAQTLAARARNSLVAFLRVIVRFLQSLGISVTSFAATTAIARLVSTITSPSFFTFVTAQSITDAMQARQSLHVFVRILGDTWKEDIARALVIVQRSEMLAFLKSNASIIAGVSAGVGLAVVAQAAARAVSSLVHLLADPLRELFGAGAQFDSRVHRIESLVRVLAIVVTYLLMVMYGSALRDAVLPLSSAAYIFMVTTGATITALVEFVRSKTSYESSTVVINKMLATLGECLTKLLRAA